LKTISLFIPYLTKQVNSLSRQNHFFWTKEKNVIYKMVADALLESGIKLSEPIPKAYCVLLRYSPSEPDYDGLVSGFKYVIDALVEHGILVGDKISMLELTAKYVKTRAKEKRGVGIVIVPMVQID
jgi:hypothetical protein